MKILRKAVRVLKQLLRFWQDPCVILKSVFVNNGFPLISEKANFVTITIDTPIVVASL